MRLRRGFGLIEVLSAALILGVVITGLFSLWSFSTLKMSATRRVHMVTTLARAELERAKVFGYSKLPLGTINTTTGVGSWTGSYSPVARNGQGGWIMGASYYDVNGQWMPSASGARYSVTVDVWDSVVVLTANNTTGYTLSPVTRRQAIVTVRQVPENTVISTMGTQIVKGGI